jgi:hypothetical protein
MRIMQVCRRISYRSGSFSHVTLYSRPWACAEVRPSAFSLFFNCLRNVSFFRNHDPRH